jgi:hypothetical protein
MTVSHYACNEDEDADAAEDEDEDEDEVCLLVFRIESFQCI